MSEELLWMNDDSDGHAAAGEVRARWQGRSCSQEDLLNADSTRMVHESCWLS